MLKAFIRSRLGQALVSRLIARAMRTPYFHLFHYNGQPYMERYWVLRVGMPRGWRELDQRRRYLIAVLERKSLIGSAREHAQHELRELQMKLHPRWGVRLHRIVASDTPVFHDHPWDYTTFILRGGYNECRPAWDLANGPTPAHVTVSDDYDGHVPTTYNHTSVRWHGAGSLLRRAATDWHYLTLSPGVEAWTLFFTSEKRQDWGFLVDGLVKVPWRVYERRCMERMRTAAKTAEPA